MKKTMGILMALIMAAVGIVHVYGCRSQNSSPEKKSQIVLATAEAEIIPEGLTEDELISYSEEAIAVAIKENLWGDEFIVDVDMQLVSKEYLENKQSNSRENIYFGYTNTQLRELFGTDMVVFRLDGEGNTVVVPFELYTNPYIPAIRDLAIGTGVILVCVTVTLATGGGAAPIAHAVFAAAAKGGAIGALSGGFVSGASNAVVTLIQTGDLNQAKERFINSGAKAFKVGAIMGVATAGIGKAISIKKAGIPSWRESELAAKKQFGGEEQVSYYQGNKVSRIEEMSTRPDLVRKLKDGTLEAIEVKNYSLDNLVNRFSMISELRREIKDRVINMPKGTLQRVVLDTRGRGYSKKLVDDVIETIKIACGDIYPDIPVSLIAY